MRRTAMRRILVVSAAALAFATLQADDQAEAVQDTIREAYIEGAHINGDSAAMRRGFHEDFRMLVLGEGKIRSITLDEWAERVDAGREKRGGKPNEGITHKFSNVDVSGNAATARVDVYKNGTHLFTDYMQLYKFEDGWKIVNKIFQSH